MTASATLDFKQRLSKLADSDRHMPAAYLVQPKHESPTGKRSACEPIRRGLQVHSIAKGTSPYEVRWKHLRFRELQAGENVQ